MYQLKTRNWNDNKRVKALLDLSRKWGVSCWPSVDNDTKYTLQTTSAFKAWLTWAYFMALRPFSGGWTYIVRPGHELGSGYKAIY